MVKLSLCMIVKDESSVISNCLSSVKGLVDEIIVVDTGSSDSTKEIAQSFGARIFDFQWCDDFSAARNFSLKQATGDWILVLDADETLSESDHKAIRDFISETSANGAFLIQRNYLPSSNSKFFVSSHEDSYPESKPYPGWNPIPIVRLFRNNPVFQFKNRIHEEISSSIISSLDKNNPIDSSTHLVNLNIPFHHFGFVKSNHPEKQDQYFAIGEKKLLDSPDDPQSLFEHARRLKSRNDLDSAILLLNRSVDLDPKFHEAYIELLDSYILKNDFENSSSLFSTAIQKFPDNTNLLNLFALSCSRNNRFKESISLLTKSLSLNSKQPFAIALISFCYYQQKDFQKAVSNALESLFYDPNSKDAFDLLYKSYIQQKKYQQARRYVTQLLKIDQNNAEAWANLASLFKLSKDFVSSNEALSRARSLGFKC